MQKRYFINNQIRAREVRLIDETGQNLGIVSIEQALQMAKERNLDLIQVTHKVFPPICKIGDYGKFRYWQEKKEREQRKKQKGGEMKNIRISPSISSHDIETRADQALKFLAEENKVRIEMRLKGREKSLQDFARGKMSQLLEIIKTKTGIKVEQEIKRVPMGLTMIISR